MKDILLEVFIEGKPSGSLKGDPGPVNVGLNVFQHLHMGMAVSVTVC